MITAFIRTDVKRHRATRQTNVTLNVTNERRSANSIEEQLNHLKKKIEKLDRSDID